MRQVINIIFGLFLICSFAANAQTVAYIHKATIDESGMKSKGDKGICYLTFINDKSKVYLTDKDGYKIENLYDGNIFKYLCFGYDFTKTLDGYNYYYSPDLNIKKTSNQYDPRLGSYNSILESAGESLRQSGMRLAREYSSVLRFSSDFKVFNIYPYLKPNEGGKLSWRIEVWERYTETVPDFYE